ncbi:MAG: hypothetical protein JNK05_13245 [Myxococcales bacterium]|nr:hypothetical protein [Myxococcales bacterium]
MRPSRSALKHLHRHGTTPPAVPLPPSAPAVPQAPAVPGAPVMPVQAVAPPAPVQAPVPAPPSPAPYVLHLFGVGYTRFDVVFRVVAVLTAVALTVLIDHYT